MERGLDLAFALLEEPREAGELLLPVFERTRPAAGEPRTQPSNRG